MTPFRTWIESKCIELNAMGRVQCIPAVRASRLIERVLVDAGVCCGLECFVLFSLLCRLSHLSLFRCLVFFVERGEETRGRTKWPRGADTVREQNVCACAC